MVSANPAVPASVFVNAARSRTNAVVHRISASPTLMAQAVGNSVTPLIPVPRTSIANRISTNASISISPARAPDLVAWIPIVPVARSAATDNASPEAWALFARPVTATGNAGATMTTASFIPTADSVANIVILTGLVLWAIAALTSISASQIPEPVPSRRFAEPIKTAQPARFASAACAVMTTARMTVMKRTIPKDRPPSWAAASLTA